MRTALCGLILLAVGVTPLGAGEDVEMKVFPVVHFAPADFVVHASIASNADNRAIEVVADSPDFYRSSTVQLNGDRAPRTTVFEFRNLPSGRYEVTARLFGSSGQIRAAVREHVNVIATNVKR
jgi:hypothetical protein